MSSDKERKAAYDREYRKRKRAQRAARKRAWRAAQREAAGLPPIEEVKRWRQEVRDQPKIAALMRGWK